MLKDDIQRFFAKIDFTEDCWIWQASLDSKGYAQFTYKGKNKRGHRVAFELMKGGLIGGMDLDHLCRNRACVKPEHLEQVTRSTNLRRGELWQSKKTHCPKGHSYDYIDNRGARRCKPCLKELAHQNYLKRKAVYA